MSKASDDFEKEFTKYLSQQGYWAFNCPRDKDGSQPADIVACGQDNHLLVDCKLSDVARFPFARIEPNQRTAMNLFLKKAKGLYNAECYFAIKFRDKVYKLYFEHALEMEKQGEKSVKIQELERVY